MSEHVRAGGSRIHRIIACPGSLQAPDSEAGAAAAKGTTAHYVGERCLMTGCNADHPSFLGQTVQGVTVDRAMAEAVQVYVDWARKTLEDLQAGGAKPNLRLEHQVDWAALSPPEAMRGSADCIIVADDLMVVGDYKNGTEYVDHVGNKQLRYYAVGALVSLPRELTRNVRRVQLTIIQPNVPGIAEEHMVRSEFVPVGDLLDFADEAIEAVALGQKADAPRRSGTHCKYCSLAGSCRARAEHSVTEAQTEFEVIVAAEGTPAVADLPLPDLAVMAAQAEDIIARAQAWLKDAKGRLEAELKAGAEVPGWKMVEKRATRVWNDEMAVEVWASRQGLKSDDIYEPRVLKSPAQMEAVVGRKNLPADLYAKVSSGFNLARTTSPKAAVGISAGDEFETVKP